LSLEDAAFMV